MKEIPTSSTSKLAKWRASPRVKPYILRYWESEFKIISPRKSQAKQRVYTRKDLELILDIKKLLYKDKFTLEGAKKQIKVIQAEKAKQLNFGFPDEKYLSALKNIKKELSSIKKILGAGE
jgi:DNA-binding transcriptional MerR regulator